MSTERTPDLTSPDPAEPAEPSLDQPPAIAERPIPRGCNPLVFGLVMATIQLACTVYFMRSC
jgi:hypothetical protein